MKTIILAISIAFATFNVVAQENSFASSKKSDRTGKGGKKPTVESRAQRSVTQLDKIVTLSEEQKTKVYDLSLARAKKHDEIREKYKGQPEKKEDARTEAKANQKEYRAAVKDLLTQEQLDKLKAQHKAKAEARKEKGKKPVKIDEEQKTEDVENMIPVED